MTFLDEIYIFLSSLSLSCNEEATLLSYASKMVISKTTIESIEDKSLAEILTHDELLRYMALINNNVRRNQKESMDDIEPYEAGIH